MATGAGTPQTMSIPKTDTHGASSEPLIGETIGRFFDAACAEHAEREALIVRHQGVRITYAELRERVETLACGLLGSA